MSGGKVSREAIALKAGPALDVGVQCSVRVYAAGAFSWLEPASAAQCSARGWVRVCGPATEHEGPNDPHGEREDVVEGTVPVCV